MRGTFEYDGAYYREIGEFIGENYLKYGFVQGTEQEVEFLVKGACRALKPGGWFVLTAIHAPAVIRGLEDPSTYDPCTNTSVIREPATSPEGETKEVTFYTTAFTYRELALMFEEAGFRVQDAYGCIAGRFSRKPLEPDDVEIMVVARR